ncbi:MAG: TolC family protein [Gammaproteobacteria bacterium]|nr:TolC family protein [Gammaproteobacteria bacterium]
MTGWRQLTVTVLLLGPSSLLTAQDYTMDLPQLIARSLSQDPRIEERRHNVQAAHALLDEVAGHGGVHYDLTTFLALTTEVKGGFFEPGTSPQLPRSDKYDWNGVTPWASLQFSVIKPLYTFGKIEHYSEAARANIQVKEQDVRLQNGEIVYDVSRAYYGYLAAQDIVMLFDDVQARLDKSIDVVTRWLDSGKGKVLQSDLYALQTGRAITQRYRGDAEAIRNTALAGLKTLAALDTADTLTLADTHIEPLPLPETAAEVWQQQALQRRPEMHQLEAGLRARRELVAASKADSHPNLFAGVVGMAALAPGRDRLDNPYITDPFNDYGATPLLGLQWHWEQGVQPAKVAQARAELDALTEKSRFARRGIPFQVTEQYNSLQASYQGVQNMAEASRAGRRWMISTYTNFEAGIEQAEDVLTAFQGYVLAHSDYLRLVNDYNMNVIRMRQVTGEY